MGIIQKATSKLISKIVTNKKKENIKIEEIKPEKKSVVVTDFSDGSSIKTETSTSGTTGQTTTKKTFRGSGGGSVTPEQQTEMEGAKAKLDQTEAGKLQSTPSNINNTPQGRKLNRDLGALSTENTGKENVINQETNSYVNKRFDYYQDLVNRRKLTVAQANNSLKKDAEAYQQQLIDAENKRREARYTQTLNENDVAYIGEFGDFLPKGDVKPLQENKTRFQKAKENVTTFVVEKGTKGIDFLKKINFVDDLYKAIPNPEISFNFGIDTKKKKIEFVSKNKVGDSMLLAVDKDTGKIAKEMREQGLDVSTATYNLEDHKFVLKEDGKWYDMGARNNEQKYSGGIVASNYVQNKYGGLSYSFYLNENKIKINPFDIGFNFNQEKGSVPIKLMKEASLENIEKWQQGVKNFALGKENLENIPMQKSLTNIETEYQLRFENKYYNKINSGEIDFETASAEFEKSPEARQLQKNYGIAYASEELGLKQKATFGKKVLGYTGYGGLELSQKVLGLTPTGARDVVVTGALVYGGYSLLTKIPASAIYGSTAVSGAIGTYQALNPLSSFEKASLGTTTALISGGILSYGAIKYLRSPIPKRTEIPFERTIKTQAVGDVKVNYNVKYGDDLIKAQKVAYSPQKLGYKSFDGYRTIVTTKGRTILNKIGFNVKNIYEGIPIDKIGYAKALKRLTQYGYTPSQAKGVLRYNAPQLINTKLLNGEILVNLNKQTALGRFKYETTKSIVDVNKELGIKTRGGKTITDNYVVNRQLTSETKVINKEVVNFDVVNERIIRIRSPSPLGKSRTEFYQKSYVASSDLKDAYLKFEVSGYDYGFKQIAKVPYKFQNLGQVYQQQQIIPFKRKITTGSSRSIIREGNIIEREVNILKVSKVPIKKAIKIKTIEKMNSAELKQMIRDIKDIYKTPKPYKWPVTSPKTTPSVTFEKTGSNTEVRNAVSKYYGQGVYERTDNVAGFGQLRSAYIPTPTTNVKDAILLKQFIGAGAGVKSIVGVESALNLKQFSATRNDLSLKNSIREDIQLKSYEKLDLRQNLGLRQIPQLKTGMRLTNSFDLALNIPNQNILKTPTFRPPKVNAVPFFNFESKKRDAKLKNKLKKKGLLAYGLLPDFTARSVGLGSQAFSIKDIEKELLSIKTGGEIRTGGKIKWD